MKSQEGWSAAVEMESLFSLPPAVGFALVRLND
jgi:hypothetical protein